MNATELKILAENILDDFQKIINDLSALCGYSYHKKTVERLERFYENDIEKLINSRLKFFQDSYTERLNFLCKKALKEMSTPVKKNEELSAKIKFWLVVYKSKPVEIIRKRYQEALQQDNGDFIYFVENYLVDQNSDEKRKAQIKKFTENKRKQRVKKETRQEIKELNKLYGFYLQSLEFTRQQGLSINRIEKLYNSLHKNFTLPLKEILAPAS